jgi:cupin 2 domain-containing protein
VQPENLYTHVPVHLPEELVEVLCRTPHLRVERIVSHGHRTPEGQWYDQDTDEWVLLLSGAAHLRIDGQSELVAMRAGDYLFLPAHLRHRVEWTDPEHDSVWLAVHVPPR